MPEPLTRKEWERADRLDRWTLYEAAVAALREIAEADPVDMVLDPTWAARVAREAWWKATDTKPAFDEGEA
jgi:hypothetical protein